MWHQRCRRYIFCTGLSCSRVLIEDLFFDMPHEQTCIIGFQTAPHREPFCLPIKISIEREFWICHCDVGMDKLINVQGFRSDAVLETFWVQQKWLRTFSLKVITCTCQVTEHTQAQNLIKQAVQ